MKKIGIISLCCIIIDQLIKTIITSNLELYKSIIVIKNFFRLTYVENDGAAWSLFSGNRIFLILIAVITIILIYLFFIKDKKISNFEKISYGLLLGGIIGNLVDRIIFGYVIDYLDFIIFNYDFPIFNFADMCIVISVFLIAIEVFRGEKYAIKSK